MSITQTDPTKPWVLPGTDGSGDPGLVSVIGSTGMSSDSRLVIGLIVGLAVFIVMIIFLSLFRKYLYALHYMHSIITLNTIHTHTNQYIYTLYR